MAWIPGLFGPKTASFTSFPTAMPARPISGAFPKAAAQAERITDFKTGEVRFPSLATDSKTIVFERDHGVAKLDLASKQVTPLSFNIAAETQESLTEFKEINSTVDDYHLAPDGKRIVFAVHGEVFTAPTDEGELQQITDSPFRDQNVTYSPDGKLVAFVSDRSGREEIHVAVADGTGDSKQVTDVDALISSYVWSPDSKTLAFTTSHDKLYTVSAEGKDLKELASSKYGDIGRPSWSPDGKWLAFDKPDITRNTDIYLLPATGGEEHKVSFDSFDERHARFSSDSKKLYFLRVEGEFANGLRPPVHLFCIPLEKIEKDPDEADAEAAGETRRGGPGGGGGGAARSTPPKEPKIDWTGLKRRTRIVSRLANVSSYVPANDGKTIYFVGSEGVGGRGGPGGGGPSSIYSIQDDGKRMSRLASGTPSANDSEDETPRRGRGFGGGSIRNLNLTRDGRTLYFQESDGVYSTSASGGGGFAGLLGAGRGEAGGRGASDSPAPSAGGARKKVTFNVSVRIDKPKEWEEMFDDAWRTMKYRFYDPKMHGKDWDAARAKYKPLVSYVGDRHELMNVINEMIGELNASHTGASIAGANNPGSGTRHLGLDLVDDPSGYYKVSYVYENGPADKDWIKVAPGDFLIAFDGKPLKVGDDYWERLGRRLNRKVELTLNSKPIAEGSWKIKYEPISSNAYADLRYDRWVKERRALTDKLSNGRVGYLHIKAMDQPSLAKFRKELSEFRHKEALVIDKRFNGGGNIEQELLAILVQRPYQVWQPRGTEPTQRPFTGYYGPKVLLQNWRSASNAEMFPAGFRALGLGKVVGTPTMGAVIGTGSYSLIDGSTIRTPQVGVYLADHDRTNMENHPVTPDIFVENSPEDNLAGRDRQLEVAVEEVLKNLKPSGVAGRE